MNLDPVRDSDMLRAELPMIREACICVLEICSIFLREAAAFGLCLAEIGEMMSRAFRGQEQELSELEVLCLEAKELIMEMDILFFEADERDDDFQFDMDCESAEINVAPKMSGDLSVKPPFHYGSESVNDQNFLAQVDETVEESDIQVDEGAVTTGVAGKCEKNSFHTGSRLSLSLKKVNLGEKGFHYHVGKPEGNYMMGCSSRMIISANEHFPTWTSFVNFADMNEEEWNLFIVKFKELLYPVCTKRRTPTNGQRQRLGTSCQF